VVTNAEHTAWGALCVGGGGGLFMPRGQIGFKFLKFVPLAS
jgi:hypothetical protein